VSVSVFLEDADPDTVYLPARQSGIARRDGTATQAGLVPRRTQSTVRRRVADYDACRPGAEYFRSPCFYFRLFEQVDECADVI